MKERKHRTLLLSTVLAVFLGTVAFAQQSSEPVSPKPGITWILVEGGEMGDFSISATEVTFDQFDAFCNAAGYKKPEDTYGRGKQPVVNVSVPDAEAFCAWLSKQTGSTVRLPTAEEFEYAASGGNKDESNLFSGSDDPDDVAWYVENSDEKNHEVATKKPNELGIYDMTGNVWELCPASNQIRGGSSFTDVHDCFVGSSYTEIADGTQRSAIVGFRVVKQK